MITWILLGTNLFTIFMLYKAAAHINFLRRGGMIMAKITSKALGNPPEKELKAQLKKLFDQVRTEEMGL
jgi:hypothetical protein